MDKPLGGPVIQELSNNTGLPLSALDILYKAKTTIFTSYTPYKARKSINISLTHKEVSKRHKMLHSPGVFDGRHYPIHLLTLLLVHFPGNSGKVGFCHFSRSFLHFGKGMERHYFPLTTLFLMDLLVIVP